MFKFSDLQLKSIANISRDVAQVVLAGLVIDPLLTRELDWRFLLGGVLLSLGLWCVNLLILSKIKNE